MVPTEAEHTIAAARPTPPKLEIWGKGDQLSIWATWAARGVIVRGGVGEGSTDCPLGKTFGGNHSVASVAVKARRGHKKFHCPLGDLVLVPT